MKFILALALAIPTLSFAAPTLKRGLWNVNGIPGTSQVCFSREFRVWKEQLSVCAKTVMKNDSNKLSLQYKCQSGEKMEVHWNASDPKAVEKLIINTDAKGASTRKAVIYTYASELCNGVRPIDDIKQYAKLSKMGKGSKNSKPAARPAPRKDLKAKKK